MIEIVNTIDVQRREGPLYSDLPKGNLIENVSYKFILKG